MDHIGPSHQIQAFTCSECRWEAHHDPGKCACPAAAPGWQEWSQVLRDLASSHSAAVSVSGTPGNNRCKLFVFFWQPGVLVIKPPHFGGFLSSLQNIFGNVSTCLCLCLFHCLLYSCCTWLLKLNDFVLLRSDISTRQNTYHRPPQQCLTYISILLYFDELDSSVNTSSDQFIK